jgi:hypothetical protein
VVLVHQHQEVVARQVQQVGEQQQVEHELVAERQGGGEVGWGEADVERGADVRHEGRQHLPQCDLGSGPRYPASDHPRHLHK